MGGPRRARTVDPRIKSPLLYRLSYRPHYQRRLEIQLDCAIIFVLRNKYMAIIELGVDNRARLLWDLYASLN
jgi:hypothetical protein